MESGERRNLSFYYVMGTEARKAGRKPIPPADLDKPERTEWLGAYYVQMGYERAENGTVSPCDTDGSTFCGKCRMIGYAKYWQEKTPVSDLASGHYEPADQEEHDESQDDSGELKWRGTEELFEEWPFGTD